MDFILQNLNQMKLNLCYLKSFELNVLKDKVSFVLNVKLIYFSVQFWLNILISGLFFQQMTFS